MVLLRRAVFATAVCWVVAMVVSVAPAAAAAPALTVTPRHNLRDGKTVTVDISGFPANAQFGYCEGVFNPNGTGPGDCGGPLRGGFTDGTGAAEVTYTVARKIFVPSLNRTVDCAVETCSIGAANDDLTAAAAQTITFSPYQPDARLRDIRTGAITGDDEYETTPFDQRKLLIIQKGTTRRFGLQVQNDGAVTDDLMVREQASSYPGEKVTVRYFSGTGTTDITDQVTGAGYTFTHVAPGQLRTVVVKFTVAPDAADGTLFGRRPRVTSAHDPRALDTVELDARVFVPGAQAVTVTPNQDLLQGEPVVLRGSGFPSDTLVGYCQAVVDATPDVDDCGGPLLGVITTDGGTFVVGYNVARRIFVPSAGRIVDCGVERCVLAAGTDDPHKALSQDLSFDLAQPDGRLVTRSTGAIIGDDVYDGDFSQQQARAMHAGDTWTFVVQAQNDGPTAEDITVGADPSGAQDPFSVRYFIGYREVTAAITGSGLTLHDLAPGQVVTIAVKVRAGSRAAKGDQLFRSVAFSVPSSTAFDRVYLLAHVTAPPPPT
jgi:hypothetical protein